MNAGRESLLRGDLEQQLGEQLSLLFVERGEKRLLVLTRNPPYLHERSLALLREP
jgi:hypothetical protein